MHLVKWEIDRSGVRLFQKRNSKISVGVIGRVAELKKMMMDGDVEF